jgi:hypothetical protein
MASNCKNRFVHGYIILDELVHTTYNKKKTLKELKSLENFKAVILALQYQMYL